MDFLVFMDGKTGNIPSFFAGIIDGLCKHDQHFGRIHFFPFSFKRRSHICFTIISPGFKKKKFSWNNSSLYFLTDGKTGEINALAG